MSLTLTTPPALEPVTLDEAKEYLRVDGDSEDATINALIKAARQKCEHSTERSFITQTWDIWLDRFPADKTQEQWWDGEREGAINTVLATKNEIILQRPNLQSVTAITTYNGADTSTVFSSSNYFVDIKHMKGRVVLNSGKSWPSDLRSFNAVNITYKAGYGDTRAFIPEIIKQAIKMLLNFLYENRGCENTEMPAAIKILLEPYRILGV